MSTFFDFVLVIGLSLVCYVQCQTACQSSFDSCVKNAFEQFKASQPPKPDWSAKKEQADKCFTDQGCDVPTFNHSKDGLDFSSMKQCFKSSADIVENCVAQTVPGFKFPEHNDSQEHQGFGQWGGFKGHGKGDKGHGKGDKGHGKGDKGHGKGHGGQSGERGDKMSGFVLAQCHNDSTKADLVSACLKALHNDSGESHEKDHHNENDHKNIFCEIKNNCTAQQSDECKTEAETIKTAECKCAQDNSDALKTAVASCLPTPPPQPESTPGASNGQGRRHFGGGNGKFGGHKEFDPTEKFCSEKQDWCSFGGQHKGGSKGGRGKQGASEGGRGGNYGGEGGRGKFGGEGGRGKSNSEKRHHNN